LQLQWRPGQRTLQILVWQSSPCFSHAVCDGNEVSFAPHHSLGACVKLRSLINPYGCAGFALAAWFAIVQKWSLPEFCWATWLGGLLYAWLCVFSAAVHIMLVAGSLRPACEKRLPFVRRVPHGAFVLGVSVLAACGALLAFRLYNYLFGFYGIFLSVFAEMEPHALFGRNGFINSDFYTPVMYLIERLWPLGAGIAIANWSDFTRPQPWKRVVFPMEQEIVRLHLFVLALPFISMLAWAVFGDDYQTVAIVLLMGLLYLMPKKQPATVCNG